MDIEKVKEAEEQLRKAMLESNIPDLDTLLADDLVFTNHLGQVLGKEDDLMSHRSGLLKISSIDISDVQIFKVGNTAVVTHRAKIVGTYDGYESSEHFRFTRVWDTTSMPYRVKAVHSCVIV